VLGQSTIRPRVRVSDDARYLTVSQIRERLGVSDMWIMRRTADANFPKAIKFASGKCAPRYWPIADIEAWEAERTRINGGAS
jgi:predicted DNA-binding transcriptional regulator AlpA